MRKNLVDKIVILDYNYIFICEYIVMESFEKIQEFSNIIFDRVEKGNLDYYDAICSYCEEMNMEIDLIFDLISPPLKQKMEEEAIKNRLLKSSTHQISF